MSPQARSSKLDKAVASAGKVTTETRPAQVFHRFLDLSKDLTLCVIDQVFERGPNDLIAVHFPADFYVSRPRAGWLKIIPQRGTRVVADMALLGAISDLNPDVIAHAHRKAWENVKLILGGEGLWIHVGDTHFIGYNKHLEDAFRANPEIRQVKHLELKQLTLLGLLVADDSQIQPLEEPDEVVQWEIEEYRLPFPPLHRKQYWPAKTKWQQQLVNVEIISVQLQVHWVLAPRNAQKVYSGTRELLSALDGMLAENNGQYSPYFFNHPKMAALGLLLRSRMPRMKRLNMELSYLLWTSASNLSKFGCPYVLELDEGGAWSLVSIGPVVEIED